MIVFWLLFAGLTAPGIILPATHPARRYWPETPAHLAHTVHTHVAVRGTVTYVADEDDGDIHFRVSDGAGHFIVAEIIPTLKADPPLVAPRKGACVIVDGISRIDPKHLWAEVHPVEIVQVVPCTP